ncbi:MAG TPA: folylpolyglutamate synthase/dihydrofolate synthase family protein [Lacibacter sp.]|nr:folylpolyglutamate synthase/dihydrofolate synthase family protein [Lacibacter sp.]HMO89616.1 folylpolyglutamate synthase/dihydrofolate synthase family protein [Lacibacter sp.]
MNYADTLSFLYAQLPMFSRVGAAAYKKDLTNTLALCELLQHPQHRFRSIHVAGTNGKGSVSHMLAAILQQAGYRTGLYTSPHLQDFRERIRINGEMIPEEFVVEFTERMQPHIPVIEPSFFELTVAMAFEWFARQQVDVAVVETGLGGRLDSTNVLTPELSVITNIGWDHMNLLGNTLELIAGEKAGIIKPGIPAVIGEVLAETRPVFIAKTRETGSQLLLAEETFRINSQVHNGELQDITLQELPGDHERTYRLDLAGQYQARNLATVLTAVRVLLQQGFDLSEEVVATALQQVQKTTGLRGRWELLQRRPRIVLDVGHNEDGMRQIVYQLGQTRCRQLHLIIGMVQDKDIHNVLSLLPKEALYYFTQAQLPRALPGSSLQEMAQAVGLSGNVYPDVNSALAAAKQQADVDDFILVCGSVFLVGEVNRSVFPDGLLFT